MRAVIGYTRALHSPLREVCLWPRQHLRAYPAIYHLKSAACSHHELEATRQVRAGGIGQVLTGPNSPRAQ
jgi:hypothetical protein